MNRKRRINCLFHFAAVLLIALSSSAIKISAQSATATLSGTVVDEQGAVAANFKEGDIELTERAEQAVVGKQARVVEEVEIGKQITEREETVRDTVRRTDVEVEEIDTDLTSNSDINSRNTKS